MWQDYELFCVKKHQKDTGHISYHWNNCPEDVLEEAGFIHDYNKHRLNRLLEKKKREEDKNYVREYGLDGISFDGVAYHGLQMKYWAKNRSLTASDLGTFISTVLFRLYTKNNLSRGFLYHSCRLEINLREDLMNNKIIKPIYTEFEKEEEPEVKKIKPWRHQLEAIKALLNDSELSLKLLTLPCGCGKSNTAAGFLRNYKPDFIIAIAPLRLTVTQLYNTFKNFLKDYAFILVDTDGITDTEIIKLKIKEATDDNKKIIIFSTFDSAENILSKMDLPNEYILVDEAHNLIGSGLIDYVNSFMDGLLLTATPPSIIEEVINCYQIYEYTIAEAIAENRICDYLVYIPFMDDDLTEYNEIDLQPDILSKAAFLFTGMLKNGSRRCIGYFSSKEECAIYQDAFKKMANYHGLNLWTDIITCDISITNRKKMISEFSGDGFDIYIINSVRILDEAIDIPKCDSEFIASVSENTSDIRLVQRLMRGCRLDADNPNKKNCLYLWSNMDNKKIFSLLKEHDPDFHKKLKTTSIMYNNQINLKEKINTENIKLDKYVTYDCISIEEAWDLMLERVKKFIDENKKRPTIKTEKRLGNWLSRNLQMHKKKPNLKFSQFLQEYQEYFKSNTEIWYENLAKVKEYIILHQKRPSSTSKDPEIKKLAQWISDQNKKYRKQKEIMKDTNISLAYGEFLEAYQEYFKSNTEIWYENLTKVKEYIDLHKKTPSNSSKYPEIKRLASWISHQNKNYPKQTYIMQEDKIRSAYKEFLEEYQEYFKSNTEIWYENLAKVKEYIDLHQKRPSDSSKDPEIKKLGSWINNQNIKYDKQKENMRNTDIRSAYREFLEEYQEYLKSNTEIWHENLAKVKEYIDLHKKTPSQHNKDPEIKKLGSWVSNQNIKYAKQKENMKKDDIRYAYREFLDEYQEYFKTNTEIWYENLAKVKKYIDLYKKTPSQASKDLEIKKLAKWINQQNIKYTKQTQIMQEDDIRSAYAEFLDDYKEYIKAADKLLEL